MASPRRMIAAAATALLASALTILSAAAQDSPSPPDFPPLPILFAGTAAIDGEPVEQGRLSVRVGDWETRRPVSVADGAFDCAAECLIAGPPSFEYIDEPVTFILDGRLAATLTFPFPNLGAPDRRTIALEFSTTPAPPPTPTPMPTPTPIPDATATPAPLIIAAAAALTLIVAVGALIARQRAARR